VKDADLWIPIATVAAGVVFIIWWDWCNVNSCIAGL
jgi:hypothetical protein